MLSLAVSNAFIRGDVRKLDLFSSNLVTDIVVLDINVFDIGMEEWVLY